MSAHNCFGSWKICIKNVWPYNALLFMIIPHIFYFCIFTYYSYYIFFGMAYTMVHEHKRSRSLTQPTDRLTDWLTDWLWADWTTCLLAGRPNALIAALHVSLFPHRCVFFARTVHNSVIHIHSRLKYIFSYLFVCLWGAHHYSH